VPLLDIVKLDVQRIKQEQHHTNIKKNSMVVPFMKQWVTTISLKNMNKSDYTFWSKNDLTSIIKPVMVKEGTPMEEE
jgi:hypothetical protein